MDIRNLASPGMSTRRFFQEHLTEFLGQLSSGDIVLICFGNIDQFIDSRYHVPAVEYRDFLHVYVSKIRARGGVPVLVTPMPRCIFSADGSIKDTLAEYTHITGQVAAEEKIPLADLASLALTVLTKAGYKRARNYYCWLDAGEHENYPEGTIDSIHLNYFGAGEMARIVAGELRALGVVPASHVDEPALQAPVPKVSELPEFRITRPQEALSPSMVFGDPPNILTPAPTAWVNPNSKFSGTAQPGTSRVLFFDRERYVGSTRVNNAGRWRWRRATCWDGGFRVLTAVGEGKGWYSPPTSIAFTVAAEIPPPLVTHPPTEVTTNEPPIFSGTAHPAAQKIVVTEDGRRIGQTFVHENGEWEFRYPHAWQAGVHTVDFTAVLGWVQSAPNSCRLSVV
jgi:lysophospholipase L1-like esterase